MSVIVVKGITKQYGTTTALENVNITIEANKIYGLLGRNGAGKTTLLNLLTNKIFPTNGAITVEGKSVVENDEVLGKIFYMMERNLYPEGLKVKEIFKWTKKIYPLFDMEYANGLANKFELKVNKKIKELSTGYTSIFKAILALSSNAKILILDEPVLGLDAYHRDLLYKEILSNYIQEPKTIIISTHLIEEISDILEEVIIIKEGKLVLKDSVETLLSSAYRVSGEASKVDIYIKGRTCLGEETIGKYKSVTVLNDQRNEALAKEMDLEFNKAELQKLFISLTNS
ncbi:ABC transporter ATP-binding protein [Alkaliphilus hydrothermalis]|uniref:ABC-2 type transport system ATP-binding protein n=1 Tax=Alkaliphilus hydrothermalis TaxID=1482730 RepID=A0ABS2NTE1_9FIRM|nr:ABC transporter ATP-binding protein [Alkaliphilus hydrothermalis]MBM7616244.1 ABC-2 type transport system ATP-binding protein [Alkaliphilus hydrothermalis]